MNTAQAIRPDSARQSALPMLAFVVLAFGGAWLLWGYWVFAMPPGGLIVSPAFILSALAGGLAPSLAALAISYWSGGRDAFAALLRPLMQWRIGWGMTAIALLLAPAAMFVSTLLQGTFVGQLKWPDPSLLAMALVWPLMAALGEELGWRGFLLPRLAGRLGLLPAALVVGLVWGLWHLPADYIALKGYGDWFFAAFLLNGPVVLTAHAIVMAWLWRRTQGSTFAAVLYHLSITTSAMIAPTAAADGLAGVLAAACGAGVMAIVAVVLLMVRRNDF